MKRKESLSFIFAHFSLFVIYVWFGALKVFAESPANPLVETLLEKTLPFMSFPTFIMLLGAYEMLIGVLFIIPRMEKAAIILLIPHMITTILPLFLLPEVAWSGMLQPTLEGQYIIKNIVVIALASSLFVHTRREVRR